MTIGTGFCFSDGVVMGADSLVKCDGQKSYQKKLIVRQGHSTQVVIAGSGIGGLIRMAANKIHKQLETGFEDYDEAEQVIGSVMNGLYEKDFKNYPTEDNDDRLISLLVGYKFKNAPPALFEVSASTISRISEFTIIGSGQVVRKEVEGLYDPAMPVSKGVLLAIHLLNVAKSRLDSVGGPCSIATLRLDGGQICEETSWHVGYAEATLQEVVGITGRMTLDLIDPGLSEVEFSRRLTDFCSDFLTTRAKHRRQIQHWAAVVADIASEHQFSARKTVLKARRASKKRIAEDERERLRRLEQEI